MRLIVVVLLLTAACTRGDDSAGPRWDAGEAPAACDASPPLELGRCIDAVTGNGCNGVLGEDPTFEPMPPDGTMAMVTGPQSATMFVMAARTVGIDPGDPGTTFGAQNPLVELTLTNEEGELLSLYRGRSAFTPEGDTFVQPSVYVVVDAISSRLADHLLRAEAVLTDAEGQVRCGSLEFRPAF